MDCYCCLEKFSCDVIN